MKRVVLSLLVSASVGAFSSAEPLSFDFKDPKGVNNVVFLLDAPLESINGTATGISGEVNFDPAAPEKTSGKIVVDANSLRVPNPTMQEHLQSDTWLNTQEHPEIVFEVEGLSGVKQGAKGSIEALAKGTMTILGKSQQIDVPITLTYLEGKLADRQRTPGDLLVVRSNFSVSRSDFGVNAGQSEDKVSDKIELRLSLAGAAPKA